MTSILAESATLRSTIVMCTFNGGAYLKEQCDSLMTQSRLPDEIIIVDDASTDGTPALVEAFARRCEDAGVEAVVHLRRVNVGFIRNFTDALKLASGDVVFLCDQDDRWYPGKLGTMLSCFEAQPDLSALFTNARLVDAVGNALGQTLFQALELRIDDWSSLERGDAFPVLLRRAVVTGATAAFRRSLVEEALPVPDGWIHDEWLATVAALLGRITFLAEPQIDYRQHGANQIGMQKRTLAMRISDMFLPRNALLRKGVDRMRSLSARFGSDPRAPASGRTLLAERMAHYERRMLIGRRARLLRLPMVVGEWRAGRYAEHGNGMSSMLRDLLRAD